MQQATYRDGFASGGHSAKVTLRPVSRAHTLSTKERSMFVLTLTTAERNALKMCLSGEVENDDGRHGDYMTALRRILRKLEAG